MGSTNSFEGCIVVGPWGGIQGKDWTYRPGGFIKKIIIKHGVAVDSIKFQTSCVKDETETSVFGGKSRNQTDTISFDFSTEYLMSISGTIGDFEGSDVVTSIGFKTNEKSYGPYGTQSGIAFTYDCKSGVIVGFHGREDKHVTAIGVYLMPESVAFGPCSTYEAKIKHELYSSMPRMAVVRNPGPWGATTGDLWDDGVFTTIKQIRVHAGLVNNVNVIYSLQFEYLKRDGKSVTSQIHGETGGGKPEVVDFDVKDEYLIGISGYHGCIESYQTKKAILSICFHTNKKTHGPFGNKQVHKPSGVGAIYGSTYYSSTASPGKVVGFHGWNNEHLTAIGVHMEYY